VKIIFLSIIIRLFAFLLFGLLFTACQNPATVDVQASDVQSVPVEEVISSEKDKREAWQKPNHILDEMGDLTNRTVADIGAGTGYFAFRMINRAKKVIAIEIEKDLIDLMENLATGLPEASKKKFETRLASPNDPKLTEGEVDDILIVNVVGYFEDRADYFNKCFKALGSNGKIHIVDYKVRRLPIEAPGYEDRVYIHLIEEELEAAGFKNIKTDDTSLAHQYLVQAEK